MQGRIGEHQAYVAQAGSHALRQTAAASRKHDRPGPVRKQRALGGVDFGEPLGARNVGTITAKGLASRALRARNLATADSLRASHSRWKPPRPFTAAIPPSCKRAATSAIGVLRRGPQAGQAIGSAWNRRFDGSA